MPDKKKMRAEALMIIEELEDEMDMSLGQIMNWVLIELPDLPMFHINDDTMLSVLKKIRKALMGEEATDDEGVGST